MGSQIAFWPMRSASFVLHTDRFPAFSQSLPERDWSILLNLQTETRTVLMPKACPVATDSTDVDAECVYRGY